MSPFALQQHLVCPQLFNPDRLFARGTPSAAAHPNPLDLEIKKAYPFLTGKLSL
jgi:hypothetical protein